MPWRDKTANPDGAERVKKGTKLGVISGVYIPVCLSILSILMFLRFGLILGQVGLLGVLGLLIISYLVDFVTTLSLSAIASNGEVKGGGAYYLISRSLGPEFGGSIGLLFYLSQVLNTALNVAGLIDCIRLSIGPAFPQGYWISYALQSAALFACTAMCLAGSGIFAKASNALLIILTISILSIPVSAIFKRPFTDDERNLEFTGFSLQTLTDNFIPHTDEPEYNGLATFRDLFGILFPATSSIFAGASMSGDLKNPSKAIPKGTLWAMLSTFIAYLLVILSMAASTTHQTFLRNDNVISATNLSPHVILAGECAVTLFSALMGVIGSAKLLQALSRDNLLPGLSVFGQGTQRGDEPVLAIFLTFLIAQVALLGDLNQIATFISMGYQMTFFVMNLACFLLKIGSAPNFRPGFKFFSWQTALAGSLMSAVAMFFIDETYAAAAICSMVFLFSLIHYLSPPKRWGDVSQNLIYHQVRKYLLRLRPEHIKFWRPQIILLINNPRRQTRLIQFCNSMKKGSLYILGHVIVTDDFNTGVHEAKLQQNAWTNYIADVPRLKAFVQLTMSPSINWGVRNLILSAGLGGMRPNIAVLGFYNMDDLRQSQPPRSVPEPPTSPSSRTAAPPKSEGKMVRRRRGDTSARILEGFLPTDVIRTENMMSPTNYMTMLEDLALKYKLNVAVGKDFDKLESPRRDGSNTKNYIDLWPIQMSAEIMADGKNVLTTNFDTYTLILQLGYILSSVPTWKSIYKLRVLVFVEYESEVDEEYARVKTLLEKLRIEAEARVFWLACGDLKTYDLIINGRFDDIDSEIMVNDILKEEVWWDELQRYRGRPAYMSSSQELTSLATILDATAGRPGVYNPHAGMEDVEIRRRPSVVEISDMQARPTVSTLSRLGVNVGIHTHHLGDEVFDEQLVQMDRMDTDAENSDAAGGSSDSDVELDSSDESGDVGMDAAVPGSDREATRQPLLGRSSVRKNRVKGLHSARPRKRKPRLTSGSGEPASESYGTMSSQPLMEANKSQRFDPSISSKAGVSDWNPKLDCMPSGGSLPGTISPITSSEIERPAPSPAGRGGRPTPSPSPRSAIPVLQPLTSPTKCSEAPSTTIPAPSTTATAPTSRPALSRQSSAARFSSKPMPETKTNVGDTTGPTIMFAEMGAETPALRPERPTFSRQSSAGRFTSRPTPDTRITNSEESGPRISFVEPPHHSRKSSTYSNVGNLAHDANLNIPEILDSYKLGEPTAGDVGSPYSTQNVALSFNDLPSRAQHLILNELMRQNSRDTAVLMSTLPIPTEGTCLDEEASLSYLSDIEVLCNELPPILLVLSNNMTVTVGL